MYKTAVYIQALTVKSSDEHIENGKDHKNVILFNSTLIVSRPGGG